LKVGSADDEQPFAALFAVLALRIRWDVYVGATSCPLPRIATVRYTTGIRTILWTRGNDEFKGIGFGIPR
jgi:hypothetical protein